jgi:predicted DNA-binding WGR domain protein
MKRCYIFQDGNSQKFWNIEFEGTGYKVTYGKLGAAGQTSEKTFATEELCRKEVDKLIQSKVKKGYVESTEEQVASAKNEGKRYELNYDDDEEAKEFAQRILKDKRLPDLKFIEIGCWWNFDAEESNDSIDEITGIIADNPDRFGHIESLAVGIMDSDISELSWIYQGDYGKALDALPNLRKLKIQGSDPTFGEGKSLPKLEEIELISTQLSEETFASLLSLQLPNLRRLSVYHGSDMQGTPVEPERLAEILTKQHLPSVKILELLDSEKADELAEIVVNSDIAPQLEVLDFSSGTLSDEGARVLLDNISKLGSLRKLAARYHFISRDMMKKLRALPVEVDLSDAQDPDGEDPDGEERYVLIRE